MHDTSQTNSFAKINQAYKATFTPQRLSLGIVVPIENYAHSPVPSMQQHIERVQLVEELGFSAVWLRDVPFNVPSFGDAGQTYDPFVYLGCLAAQTQNIALGVASLILPLRHPAHTAKAAASVDVLSNGRLLLGVASGDRPDEYPAMNINFHERGESFRENFEYIESIYQDYPAFENAYGAPSGNLDLLPKPTANKIPLLITGGSQQSPDWIAQHGDGWITYPRNVEAQASILSSWRNNIKASGQEDKPAIQSLYIDVVEQADAPPQAIHLGFRSGVNALRDYLQNLQAIGINHVALNLRFNQNNIQDTLQTLAKELLPQFT